MNLAVDLKVLAILRLCGLLSKILLKILLFLCEEEFRRTISGFSVTSKWHEFMDVLKYIADFGIINLYSLEQLSSLTDRIN